MTTYEKIIEEELLERDKQSVGTWGFSSGPPSSQCAGQHNRSSCHTSRHYQDDWELDPMWYLKGRSIDPGFSGIELTPNVLQTFSTLFSETITKPLKMLLL